MADSAGAVVRILRPLLIGDGEHAVERDGLSGLKGCLDRFDPTFVGEVEHEAIFHEDAVFEILGEAFIDPDGQVGTDVFVGELVEPFVLKDGEGFGDGSVLGEGREPLNFTSDKEHAAGVFGVDFIPAHEGDVLSARSKEVEGHGLAIVSRQADAAELFHVGLEDAIHVAAIDLRFVLGERGVEDVVVAGVAGEGIGLSERDRRHQGGDERHDYERYRSLAKPFVGMSGLHILHPGYLPA